LVHCFVLQCESNVAVDWLQVQNIGEAQAAAQEGLWEWTGWDNVWRHTGGGDTARGPRKQHCSRPRDGEIFGNAPSFILVDVFFLHLVYINYTQAITCSWHMFFLRRHEHMDLKINL